jgi:hypothetical protein
MGRDILLMLALIAAIGGYVVIQEQRVDSETQRADHAQVTIKRLAGELDQAKGKERVVVRYVDRVQIVRERGATITREIPVYVTTQAESQCTVPVGFVWLHDAAAQGVPVGDPTGDPDAPATDLGLAEVTATVVGNYGVAHELREQVIGLQEYIRVLQAANGDAQAH